MEKGKKEKKLKGQLKLNVCWLCARVSNETRRQSAAGQTWLLCECGATNTG